MEWWGAVLSSDPWNPWLPSERARLSLNKPRTSLDILNNTGWCARFYTYTFSMLLIFDQLMFSFIVFIFTIPRIVLLSCMFYLEVLLLASGGQFIHINSTMIIWAQHVKMRNIYLNCLITGVLFDNQDGYLERLIWNIIWKGGRKQKHDFTSIKHTLIEVKSQVSTPQLHLSTLLCVVRLYVWKLCLYVKTNTKGF